MLLFYIIVYNTHTTAKSDRTVLTDPGMKDRTTWGSDGGILGDLSALAQVLDSDTCHLDFDEEAFGWDDELCFRFMGVGNVAKW